MKNLLTTLLTLFALSLQAAPPTTGQFLFQRKPASGPFTPFGVTPVANQAFGWDGTNVVMLAPSGGTAWGGITGTLTNQTDLNTALGLKLSLAGVLPLAGFSSITGTLPAGNLPATAQLTTGTLALGGFGSITGTLADARLSSNVQLEDGTLALNGFGSVTGTLAAARIADLSATYLTVAAAASGYQPLDADLTSWALITRASGFDTFTTTPSSANLASLVTGETGSGALVFGTSPTLTTPALGTPSALVLTNATGLSGSAVSGGTFGAVNGSALTALNGTQVTTGTVAAARIADLSATYLTLAAGAAAYQPLDADLTALAGLSGTNNIYYRSGAATWTPVTVGTGLNFNAGTLSASSTGGTVTNVALTAPNIFTVAGSPIATSGTLALSLANQGANTVLAGPTTGSAAAPTFRALVAADIPSLSSVYQPLDADLTALAALSGTDNIYYRSAANTWTSVTVGSGLDFTAGTLTTTGSNTLIPTTFADAGARSSATPAAVGQLGFQLDTSGLYFSTGVNAGDWNGSVVVSDLTVANGANIGGSGSTGFLQILGSASGQVALQVPATATSGVITMNGGTNAFSFTNGTASLTVPAGVSGSLTSIALVTPGTGVNTFLATPSSANLAAAVTGETGTGALVFGTSPDFTTAITLGGVAVPTISSTNTLTNKTINGASNTLTVRLGSDVTGTLSGSSVSGGTFGAVNGSALTALNATNVASGTLDAARLPATAQLTTGTLALNGFGSITGTLPAARVGDLSATYLTTAAATAGYQPLDADLTAIAALSGTSTQYYRSGAGAWSAVTYGTGLTFSGGVLTPAINGATGSTDNVILRADGTGAKTVQGGGVLTLSDDGLLSFPDGVTQVFNPNGTNAGINVGSQAGDPAAPSNGDLWYDSTANELTARINGANVAIGGVSLGANTFTGAQLVSVAGAASTPAVKLSGALYSGGSSTTTKPQLLVEDTAAVASNAWSTAGTAVGGNVDTAFAGNLVDLKVEDVTKFRVDYTGAITATGTIGTVAAGDAAAGSVGEYVNSLVAVGSAVGLSNGAAGNVTSISLTAGDWDVIGAINFVSASATVTQKCAGITTTSVTIPSDGSEVFNGSQTTVASFTDGITLPRKRINVSGTTTVYLVGKADFSAGSVSAFGTINARRVR